jgi:AcrR family transcriptional regulator
MANGQDTGNSAGRTRRSRADVAPDAIAELTAEMTGKVVEKVAAKFTAKAARQNERAARATTRARVLDIAVEHLQALDVWTRQEPTGRRPRFRREDIAACAIGIADAEGIDAVSMRRIALDLGVGTMTLYHYVRTKDELLTLIVDELMGDVVLADEEALPTDWRAALTTIARRTRDMLLGHPWILDITDDPPIGPNTVRHFDQTLRAVASLPASFAERCDAVNTVDEYVFGYCLHHRNQLRDDGAANEAMLAYIEDLVGTGGYPQIAALAAERGLAGAWHEIAAHQRDPERFDRNLARLLDGIAASLGELRS